LRSSDVKRVTKVSLQLTANSLVSLWVKAALTFRPAANWCDQ